MNRKVRLSDLFYVNYGTNLELNGLNQVDNGVNYVSRTSKNNGVSAQVEKLENIKPLKAGLITVASGSSSVLASFVQPEPFYSGRDVYYLEPKSSMTLKEKIYYCMCIRNNKYKYNYGRQANKTLAELLVPKNTPSWVNNIEIPDYSDIKNQHSKNKTVKLNARNWDKYEYKTLFKITRGKGPKVGWAENNPGSTPLISSTMFDNGVKLYVDYDPTHPKNIITVPNNGSVGMAFYQPEPFCATTDVNVLYPKFDLNPFIAMFLITLIRKEKYKYSYGRKWGVRRMKSSVIKLPTKSTGNIDFDFMEKYIKSINYSKYINKSSDIIIKNLSANDEFISERKKSQEKLKLFV